jgi:hypothetical protein
MNTDQSVGHGTMRLKRCDVANWLAAAGETIARATDAGELKEIDRDDEEAWPPCP